MINLRYPNITGGSPTEQMAQMRNYLHQLVDQLQWAMNDIDASRVVVTSASNASGGSSASEKPTVDSQTAFSAIKPLIIKSADIVNAYYDVINRRLEGEYVATSVFGEFKEKTTQDITETSEGIERTFTNIQQIESDIGDINFSLAEVNAHIKSGKVSTDENGLPIYGLEVGQKNIVDGQEVFNRYARFTSDRLSFYDKNGFEVAYISGYKLYITNAEVTGTLKLGGYLVETAYGLTFKWVGRG